MIIDTHCHVYASEMENAEEIIKEASQHDIHMILNGTDPSSNVEILDLADKYENVHAALGYFCSLADEITDEDIVLLDNLLEDDNVVAVGEIGLDYYQRKDNKDMQKELFEKMLVLAGKHNLPVIVHSRKSAQDTLDILKKHDVKGSMHSYQGSAEMAREFIKAGFYIGMGGSITYKGNKKIRRIAENIGIEHVLIETDSPYLTPEDMKGKENTPLNLKYIIRKIAEEFNMSDDEVTEITADNAKRLFKIE